MRVANNFSTTKASNTQFAVALCQQESFIPSMLQILTDETLLKGYTEITPHLQLLDDGINLLRVISGSSENRETLRTGNVVDIMRNFVTTGVEGFKVRSLLTLANIVDESEAHFLDDEANVVKTLVDYCTVALKAEHHRYILDTGNTKYYFYLVDILLGLEKLSSVDSNKTKIVEVNGISLLNDCLKEGPDKVKISASKTLWCLAFDEGD